MLPLRPNRGFLASFGGVIALGLLATACDTEPGQAVQDDTQFAADVRIVEVLSVPATSDAPAFIELRNDAEKPVDLAGWTLTVGRDPQQKRLRPRPLDGTLSAGGPDVPLGSVAPHGLALVVDEQASDEQVVELACEAAIRTTRESLGSAHAGSTDPLAGSLAIQQRRHCIPVYTVSAFDSLLPQSEELLLSDSTREIDRAVIALNLAPRGVAYERRGGTSEAFALSPIGATPGARNYFRADYGYINDTAQKLPLDAMSSSPWRVGDMVLSLRREADDAEQGGDTARAAELRAEADEVMDGKLPDNPLAQPFADMVASAETSANGSFFQLNHHQVISSYVDAKQRGVDVRLTTDAAYMNNPSYTPGFNMLQDAGIPLVFDLNGDRNRSPLSHNKFMTIDGQWILTGSFNPIEDEPQRVHADNSLVIRSREGSQLHDQEFETLFSGKFGTQKRKFGVGGGRFAVDGAPIAIRFSPGLTSSMLKRRATELANSGDPIRACQAQLSSGREAIPERYRALDPCGGPHDLVMAEVARATSSVYFVSFSISWGDLGDVMHERLNNGGIDLRGVVDPTVYSRGLISGMTDAGADIRYTPNSNPECPSYVTPRYSCPTNPNKVWLHHKFLLIDYGTDHPVVITGSHNLSKSAESSNDETLLVIRDRAIAEKYYRMFREAYNHPQTEGTHRSTDGLSGLAITEVRGAADPEQAQMVEIANVSSEPVALDGLELWNRRGSVLPIDQRGTLAPGERAIVAIGSADSLGIRPGTTVISFETDPARPVVGLQAALVLRRSSDGRWLASYDPITSEQNLPEGAAPGDATSFRIWSGFDGGVLDALEDELLGVNTTPSEEVPTWASKGLYSDWADENHVTRTSLVLMRDFQGDWKADPIGTPGW